MPTFRHASDLPVPRQAVWDWHLRPGALVRLNPPWERARVVRSGGVAEGSEVVLQAAVAPGIETTWVMEHHDVTAPERFRDRMRRGPFARWEHLHAFEALSAGRTRLVDEIDFTPPLGPAGALAAPSITARLRRMFAYRHATLAADLEAHAAAGGRTLHIAITGASGLIGRQLEAFLTTGGHRVTRLVRGTPRPGEVRWDPAGDWDAAPLDGVDAVVHLAGEGIAAGRWTEERKRRIRESRARGTRSLVTALARRPHPPRTFISASAVGIYGDRGDEPLTEAAPPGTDFLATVGREWEAAAAPIAAAGARVVQLRFGVVLSPAGGALAKMLPAFRAGVAGRLGSGHQRFPWIALDDALYLIHAALLDDRYTGALNATAPDTPTNAEFTATLGRVLRRPTLLPVPAVALKLLFGEMAEATILAGQRVVPERLTALGFRWRYPALEGALRHALGR
ncbi:MAG TPA: TIGR01777 family oxidoreductase [Gemmatimonadales bacterium]|nr:TIGR01777 family oxidoreductase [Gemmatimonadales bacterium]